MGHRDLVSGFSFCQHPGQSHICVSSSSDGSVRFWDAASRLLIREHAAHQVSARHALTGCPSVQWWWVRRGHKWHR